VLEHGFLNALRGRERPASLLARRLRLITRIAHLDPVRRQSGRIADPVGQRRVGGPDEIQNTLDVVGLGELDLVPDEDGLQEFLRSLLGMEGRAIGKVRTAAEQVPRDLQVASPPSEATGRRTRA
jgi:hypothetical protein